MIYELLHWINQIELPEKLYTKFRLVPIKSFGFAKLCLIEGMQ